MKSSNLKAPYSNRDTLPSLHPTHVIVRPDIENWLIPKVSAVTIKQELWSDLSWDNNLNCMSWFPCMYSWQISSTLLRQ